MRSTLRKKVTVWTILVLSTSVILFAHADRNTGLYHQQQSILKRGPPNAEQVTGAKAKAIKLKREEHLVGDLPWAEGQEPITSYAGHFPIRNWHQSGYRGETGMFYWYFPAVKPLVPNPPLLFWFQGGPGSSSMIGQFFGNGPIYLTANNTLARRETHWADEYSIVFIDQPVGTGYSYVTRLQDNTSDEEGEPVEGDPPSPASSEALHANDDEEQPIEDQVLVDLHDELLRDQAEEQEIFAQLLDQDITTKLEHIRLKKSEKQAALYSKGYVKDERGVAADLLTFMDQLYTRYPELKKADLFLTGESYAGKYVPALAYAILQSNQGHRHRYRHNDDDDGDEYEQIIFPLKGIALGNSLTEPIKQIRVHSDHAYILGLVSRTQAEHMKELQDLAVKEAHSGRFLAANQARVDVFDYFKNVTGGINWYDIRKGDVPNDWSKMETFLNRAEIKDALNIYGPRLAYLEQNGVSKKEIKRITEGRARTKFFKDPLVIKTMAGDIMKSAAWMVSDLLRQGIRVVAYQGIFDFRDAVAGSESWLEGLDWEGAQNFTNTDRQIWVEGGRLAGYVTQVPGLSEVVVLGAGHVAPMDQPKSVKAVIKSLVEGTLLDVSTSVERVQHTI
ncbi:Alpha/Beta hydrolase protein [Linnemannia elongata]|nr:Alpha/Beta hydrolase protein [Linnemannia elongata]